MECAPSAIEIGYITKIVQKYLGAVGNVRVGTVAELGAIFLCAEGRVGDVP
jgi:hypothetical protein